MTNHNLLKCKTWVFLFLGCALLRSIAQQTHHRSPVAGSGTLMGRIFAITGGGDLKPARMADVDILFIDGTARDGTAIDSGDTAGLIYMQEYNKAMESYNHDFEANPNWSDHFACMEQLRIFYPVLANTQAWVGQHKKFSQIIATKTDEEGRFSASLPAGKYLVEARGRAGFNEAMWEADVSKNLTIQPGRKYELKLSSPSKACLDMPD